jgi:hypothetical protein
LSGGLCSAALWPFSPTKTRTVPFIPAAQPRPHQALAMPLEAVSHARSVLMRGSGTFAKYMIVLAKQNQASVHWTTSKLSHWQCWENFVANR